MDFKQQSPLGQTQWPFGNVGLDHLCLSPFTQVKGICGYFGSALSFFLSPSKQSLLAPLRWDHQSTRLISQNRSVIISIITGKYQICPEEIFDPNVGTEPHCISCWKRGITPWTTDEDWYFRQIENFKLISDQKKYVRKIVWHIIIENSIKQTLSIGYFFHFPNTLQIKWTLIKSIRSFHHSPILINSHNITTITVIITKYQQQQQQWGDSNEGYHLFLSHRRLSNTFGFVAFI